jgi:choice-of-anchor A domain-containing protein
MGSVSIRAVAALGALVLSATAASAFPLGDYNVMVWGNFSATGSDVQGRLAAGGNVNINNYSVGDQLPPSLRGGATITAGGNVNFPSGTVYYGNVVAGGNITGHAATNWLQSPYQAYANTTPAVDFAAQRAGMTELSQAIAAMTTTGTDDYKWSQLFLTGTGPGGVQVFDVSASDLASASNIVVAGVDPSATLIINVHGTTASMQGGMDSFFAAHNSHVLFNFIDATTLNFSGIGLEGSILAPNADIHGQSGVIWGQVVGASWTGNMQINQVYYDGYVPALGNPRDNDAVPVPPTAALLLPGLALFAWRRRRAAA